MGLLDMIARALTGAELQPDGYPLHPDDPLAPEQRLLSEVMREAIVKRMDYAAARAESETGRRIAALAGAERVRMAKAALARAIWQARHGVISHLSPNAWRVRDGARRAASELLRGNRTPLAAADVTEMLDALRTAAQLYITFLPLAPLLGHAERLAVAGPPDPALRESLTRMLEHLSADRSGSKLAARLRALLGDAPSLPFDAEERWVDEMRAETRSMPDEERRGWEALQAHLLSATAVRPSDRWLKDAARLRDAVGPAEVRDWLLACVEAARANGQEGVMPRNADFLRGVVWCVAEWEGARPEAHAERVIADLALAMARKLPGVGVRSSKVLNACITALGRMPGDEPLAQLTRLRAKVKGPQAQRLIAETLQEAAQRAGMTPADLEEVVTPTFGMGELGLRRETLGGWTAELRVVGPDEVETRWTGPNGKTQKSPPAALKGEHAAELKELKETAKAIEGMLPAQRDRIERLLLDERVLPYPAWRERYLDHPLVGVLARRLLWHFEDGAGAARRAAVGGWAGEAVVDADDRPLDWLSEGTRVRLWHPIGFPVEEVAAWRGWLERHEVTQPFKQAHREVYVITDAELRTDTYSNRFAAHIVRQHQLAALCRARGWRYTLQGGFDSANSPTLALPRYGLSAELWVEPCLGDPSWLSDMGIALYVSTDQVRFVDEARQAMRLSEVPALVFSEVMRDVDLFVGVASVGADPAWADQGARPPQWSGYWESYAFGDLNASARTRREVLERLLPRLKIAARCRIDGKFLVVRGNVRTYRIHLGSGNIMMEPNNQYLCIVPDRGAAAEARKPGQLWLPFEGDGMLSVILSKAFLLAADTKITDGTITRQICGTFW